jgi:hypothetical protein
MDLSEHLQGILASLPGKPGCYIMKDAEGKVIYVGKAINLRNRVRSYFHANLPDHKTRQLVRHILDIESLRASSAIPGGTRPLSAVFRTRVQPARRQGPEPECFRAGSRRGRLGRFQPRGALGC